MKISTKGRYALRLLLDIAQNQQDGFVSLKEIAERQEVSKKYLEQIIPLLSRAELLQTSRGYQGGYRLCRAPEDYTVYEILSVAEGGLAPVACLDQPENTCPRAPDCLTLPVWEGLEKTIRDYLRSITLQTILDGKAHLKQAQKAAGRAPAALLYCFVMRSLESMRLPNSA